MIIPCNPLSWQAINYLDPGTGSLLIQIVIGVLIGGWFVIKNYWIRIKQYFNKLGKKNENPKD